MISAFMDQAAFVTPVVNIQPGGAGFFDGIVLIGFSVFFNNRTFALGTKWFKIPHYSPFFQGIMKNLNCFIHILG